MDTISLALVDCTSMFIRSCGANRSLRNEAVHSGGMRFLPALINELRFFLYFTTLLNNLNLVEKEQL